MEMILATQQNAGVSPHRYQELIDSYDGAYDQMESQIDRVQEHEEELATRGRGTVYILGNRSMPGIVKIGYTCNDVCQRVKQLSSATGVPEEFFCIYDNEMDYAAEVERVLHENLTPFRVNGKREFFRDIHPTVSALWELEVRDAIASIEYARFVRAQAKGHEKILTDNRTIRGLFGLWEHGKITTQELAYHLADIPAAYDVIEWIRCGEFEAKE